MADAPQLQMWLTWCELTKGPRGTLEEFRTLLGKYPPSAIFIACAKLSIGLNYGPEAEIAANETVTARWIPILFPSSLVPLVSAHAAQGRAIFFQGQLRMLVTEAMRLNAASECPASGENNEFGELLLPAGEMLYKPYGRVEDDLDEKANLIATFLPIYELGLPTDPIMLFLRFYIFLTINIPRLPDSVKTFDVSALFEEQFGFSLKLYCEFILAFINHAMIERNKKPDEGPIDGTDSSGPRRVETPAAFTFAVHVCSGLARRSVAEGIAGSGAAQGRHGRALRSERDEACPGSRNKDAVDPGLAGLLLTCAGKNRQRFVFLGRIEENF